MKQKYLVEYNYDYYGPEQLRVFEAPKGATWRELQEIFDPDHIFDCLKFFPLDIEIPFIS